MNVYKYILCTSGGLLTSMLTYNVLLYRDHYNDHKFYDLYSVYCNIEYNLLEKFIGTTTGFFVGFILTSKLN